MARATTSRNNNNDYLSNGVSISPPVPTVGEKVKVVYDGLLAKSGANHIYAYVGFGDNWKDNSFYQMNRSNTGFETTIPVSVADTINVCFKDCANNWDNNSGRNYTFDATH